MLMRSVKLIALIPAVGAGVDPSRPNGSAGNRDVPDASRKRGVGLLLSVFGGHVTRIPRAAKLWVLVNPWATRRRTWRRLLIPSMGPLVALLLLW